MAEAAIIGAAAQKIDVKEVTEAIKSGVEVGAKIEREAERVEQKLYDILKRENPTYDYEKVAVRSLYGTGIFAIGWLGLKLGQFMIWIYESLQAADIFQILPDNATRAIQTTGNILDVIDEKFMAPYGPAIPVAITGASAFIEYLRVRQDMPEKQRKIADAACGLTALGILYAVNEGANRPVGTVNPETGELTFTCATCGAAFPTGAELTQHITDAHRRGP